MAVRWDEGDKLMETRERAAGVAIAKHSGGQYAASRGCARPPKKEAGQGRKQRKTETKFGFAWLKDVGQWLSQARGMFGTYPSVLPLKGSCFAISVVMAILTTILVVERPDLYSEGQWSADPQPDEIAMSLWLDSRKFLTPNHPPWQLGLYCKQTGSQWQTNNEAVVLRFLDAKRPHQPLANVLVGNYFVNGESSTTISDIEYCMDLNVQLLQLVWQVQQDLGKKLILFVCGDLHFVRAALREPCTDNCPFCSANPNRRIMTAVAFTHYVYDGDHMIVGIILCFIACVYRRLPLDVQHYFQQWVREHGLECWAPSSYSAPWRSIKIFIGWHEVKRGLPLDNVPIILMLGILPAYGCPGYPLTHGCIY